MVLHKFTMRISFDILVDNLLIIFTILQSLPFLNFLLKMVSFRFNIASGFTVGTVVSTTSFL